MLLSALALAAGSPQTPRAFVTQLYAAYRSKTFSPLAHPERVFAPRLVAAIRQDERLAGSGEVGALDWDPICQCQDADGLRADIRRVVEPTANAATAWVTLRFPGEPRPISGRLHLIRTGSGWRIGDLSTAQEDSVLTWLEQHNAKAARHRR